MTQAIGNVTMMQGRVRDAEPLLALSIDQLDLIGSEYDRLRFMGNYGVCLTMSGRYREAMALHDRAFAHATASSNSSGLAVALTMRAFSERAIADPAVLSTIEVGREHALRSNERLLYYLLVRHHAWVEGLAGRIDASREHTEEARAVVDELGGNAPYDDLFIAAEAQVALATGDVDQAILIASEVAPRLRDDQRALGLGLAEQVWGLALAARKDPSADTHITTARDVFVSTGQRLAAARLDLDWARVLEVHGDHVRAEALRAAAVALYTEAGAPELIAMLDTMPTSGVP